MIKWAPKQLARDLQWVVSSPSLLESNGLPIFEFPADVRASATEIDEHHLASFLMEHCCSHRVGDYFEALVHYALRFLSGFEVILAHHQIFEGPRTIGEIDFLVQDADGRKLHLEVAVKFFLHLADEWPPVAERALIGPNPADNLHRKLEHLEQHQLPLSRRLDQTVDLRKVLMLGRIHHHFTASPPADCSQVGRHHLSGLWCRISELRKLVMLHAESAFRIQQKPFWLAPPVKCDWMTSEQFVSQIEKHFRNSTSSLLFSIMEADEEKRQALAETPVFVVSDTWPRVERSA